MKAEVLRNKNFATRLQILVEIAATGGTLHQRGIADRLGISPQAVSDYLKHLLMEGLIDNMGRSSWKVSPKGVNWMLKMTRELGEYVSEANRAVTNITVCAAIAESDLRAGQSVGLTMKEGELFGTGQVERGARGIAVHDAKRGEDVGVSSIEGLVELVRGKVTIFEVPNIQEGGSRAADLEELKNKIGSDLRVGAIGIEALVTLRRVGVEPKYRFGVVEAAIEGAKCGLSFQIACTTDDIGGLIKRLQENALEYQIISLSSSKNTRSKPF